jgi:hypothetical protein
LEIFENMVYWLMDINDISKVTIKILNRNAMHRDDDAFVPRPCVKHEHVVILNGLKVHVSIQHKAELLHHDVIRHESMVPIHDNLQRMEQCECEHEHEHEAILHNANSNVESMDGRDKLLLVVARLQRTVLEQPQKAQQFHCNVGQALVNCGPLRTEHCTPNVMVYPLHRQPA